MSTQRDLHEHEAIESQSPSPEAIGVPQSNSAAELGIAPQMDQQLLADHSTDIDQIEYKLEGKPSRLKPKHFVYLCTWLACLSSILLGYDIGR